MRALGVKAVKTKYVLIMNPDAAPWVLDGEDPLDWIRVLYSSAERSGDRFGGFAPYVAEHTYIHEKESS